MEKLLVIKIGGSIIDDEEELRSFIKEFATISTKKILVHGGGKLATKLADQLGIKQELVEGRRITDAETLKIVVMVYAGHINKQIVSLLQASGCKAVGICGADGNAIEAHKRIHPTIDYGFVGDIDKINLTFLENILTGNDAIVIAPITHDMRGQLLNTNADTIAQEIAKSFSRDYDVELVYTFEKNGVLLNINDENSVIKRINPVSYQDLKSKQAIFAGMIPKLDNAFAALSSGVGKVVIGKAEKLQQLIAGHAGTTIINE